MAWCLAGLYSPANLLDHSRRAAAASRDSLS
jgi:hypothetical protein